MDYARRQNAMMAFRMVMSNPLIAVEGAGPAGVKGMKSSAKSCVLVLALVLWLGAPSVFLGCGGSRSNFAGHVNRRFVFGGADLCACGAVGFGEAMAKA